MCSLLVWLFVAAYSIIVKKRFIGLNLFVLLGIYFPMLLYFLGWSAYVDNDPAEEFYYIFACLNLCMILFNLLVTDTCKFDLKIMPSKVSTGVVLLVDTAFVFLFLIESYLGSHSFVPALVGIDIHTYSAPIIVFVTRNLFLVVILNIVSFLVNRQKRYLVIALALIALPVVTRNMRITAIITVVQVATFLALYFTAKRRTGEHDIALSRLGNKVKRHKLVVVLAIVVAVAFISGSAAMTNNRMNHYGEYDLDYSTEIAYTGPEILSDVMPVYYGYFPMSFNNLNLSLKYGTAEHNYVGLYSFASVYFGLLQWDNVFGLDAFEPSAVGNRVYSTEAATVATGFWDYWYDYGYLCFIPIAAMILICAWITRRLQIKPSLFMFLQYCYFIPLVFFESFQNVFFGSETLYEVIFALILVRFAFGFGSTDRAGALRESRPVVLNR